MGYEGFSGNESILLHRHSPCRISEARRVHADRARGVGPRAARPPADRHAPDRRRRRPARAAGGCCSGTATSRSRSASPTEDQDGFYRNGEGDEVVFVHHGSGVLHTIFGRVPYAPGDYVVIPRGTTHRWEPQDGEQVWLCFHTPGEIETPNRYRNRYGQLLEHAPFSQRDFHPPAELETIEDDGGEHEVIVRVRDGHQRYVLDYHPFDVVGWDGYVYPYTFSIHDFEPKAGRLHQPPPAHQTFQGPNFVICSFCPRMLDWDPEAIVLPYHHSNLQSEEAIYYVDGSSARARASTSGRSRCTRAACRTGRSRASSSARSA